MRYSVPALLCLVVFTAAPAADAGATFNYQSTGFGRVFYEPEAFDLRFGVMTHRVNDLQGTRTAHDAVLKGIDAAIKKIVPKDKLVSLRQSRTHLQTSLRYRHADSKGDPAFTFTSDYVLRVSDPALLLDLQSALIEAGVNRIEAVQEFTPKLEEHIAQATKQAIAHAKANAKLIADQVGWELGHITSVSITRPEDNNPGQRYGHRSAAYEADAPPPVAAEVSVTVSLNYRVTTKE